jgi:hypothetical protein
MSEKRFDKPFDASLRGQMLTERQQEINRKYSGGKATFYARQLSELIETGMAPTASQTFISEMDRLTQVWAKLSEKESAA